MNPFSFVVFAIVFFMSLRLFYEAWFAPEKYQDRIDNRRKLVKGILGFSFWKEGKVNIASVKLATIIALIGSLLGLIVSITGPIHY